MLVGPGDDAAVLRVRRARRGVHRPDGRGPALPPRLGAAADVGHRAAAQNLSDINAMGGRAHSLTDRPGRAGRPARRSGRWTSRPGFAEECALVGASVVGGDLTRSDEIVIAVTVLGACTAVAGAALGRPARRRAGAGRPPGLGRRRAGRARPRLPLAPGAGRGLPAARAAVRRRAGRRRGRRDRDDRRLRRAARRRRPPRRRLRRGDRRPHRRVRDPRAAARGRRGHRRRPAAVHPRRGRRPRAAGDVPGRPRCPEGWTVIGAVCRGRGRHRRRRGATTAPPAGPHF